MFGLSFVHSIYLYEAATDMRKSFDGLVGLVTTGLGKDPVRDGMFVFVNKRRDRMKILVWDRHGFWLLYKRLEAGCFQIPPRETLSSLPSALTITYEQLVMILEGIDLATIKRRKRYQLAQEKT